MFALLGLGARRVDRAIRESLTLLQSRGDRDPVHRPRLLVFLPGRSGDISTDDSLDGQNTQFAYLHATVLQHWPERLGNLGREIQSEEVCSQGGNGLCQDLEPGFCAEREEDSLIGDTLYSD